MALHTVDFFAEFWEYSFLNWFYSIRFCGGSKVNLFLPMLLYEQIRIKTQMYEYAYRLADGFV